MSFPNIILAEYSFSEIRSIFVMQGFAGLSLFSVLLLMALGLAIIFGQMDVVNLAHGEFMALGAYMVYLCSQITADHFPAFHLITSSSPLYCRSLCRGGASGSFGGVGDDPIFV